MLCDVLWYIDGHHCKLAERSCTVPVVFKQFSECTIANSMTVQYITARCSHEDCLDDLSSHVESAPDIAVPLEKFLPSDRRRRYEYIEHVKTGLKMPTILVT